MKERTKVPKIATRK